MPSKKNKAHKNNKHEILFEWPHTEPREVIVSGSFNGWARTCHLTKGPNGFFATVKVPWGSKTAYKYIVDGVWTTHPDQPTETDRDGNINNMYTAPPKPIPVEGNGKPAPELASITTAGTLPQLVAHFADTVAAREGTTSALGYVASGLGAALHNAVGVDPINAEQIAIPTPLQTAATTASGFDVPDSAVSEDLSSDSAPPSEHEHEAVPQAPESANAGLPEEPEAVTKSKPSIDVASDIPIPTSIVPVNAAENNTVPTTAMEPVSVPAEETQIVGDATAGAKDEFTEPSTHTAVVVNGGSPGAKEISVKAEEEAVPAEHTEPHPVSGEEEELSKSVVPVAAAVVPAAATIPAASDEHAPITAEPASKELSAESIKIETPEATTPDSGLNPSSVLAPDETPGGASAAAVTEEKATFQDIPVSPAATLSKEIEKPNEAETAETTPEVEETKVESGPVAKAEPPTETVDATKALEVTEKKEPEAKVAEVEVAHVEPQAVAPAEREPEVPVEPNAVVPASPSDIVPVQEVPTEVVDQPPKAEEKVEVAPVEPVPITETVPAEEVPKQAVENDPQPVAEPVSEDKAPEHETKQTDSTPTVDEPSPAPIEPPTAQPVLAPPAEAAVAETTSKPEPKAHDQPVEVAKEAAPVAKSAAQTNGHVKEQLAAQTNGSNGHAKEQSATSATSTATASTAKEQFSSKASAAPPSAIGDTPPARKKKSSIFGKLKHIFTGGDSDKKKT